ncbi:unnamed protein product, partial [Mesorhabditis spiculigera]
MSITHFKADNFLLRHNNVEWTETGPDGKKETKSKTSGKSLTPMQRRLLFLALLGIVAPNDSSSSSSVSTTTSKDCGLPDEFLTLPEYAQKELEAVWGAYTQGDCEAEKQKTKDILDIVRQFGEEFGPEAKPKGGKKGEKPTEPKPESTSQAPELTTVEKEEPAASTGTPSTTVAPEITSEVPDGDLTTERLESITTTESELPEEREKPISVPEESTANFGPEDPEEAEPRKKFKPRNKFRPDGKRRQQPKPQIDANTEDYRGEDPEDFPDADQDAQDHEEFQGHTPRPTQGYVPPHAPALQIGVFRKIPKAPHEYDYLDPKQKAAFNRYHQYKKLQSRHQDDYDGGASNSNTPVGGRVIFSHSKKFRNDYQDYEHEDEENEGRNSEDPLAEKFDTPDAPFLQGASAGVRRQFMKTWGDKDIVSEPLRAQKIQLLAVSLLTGKQLEKYNAWATKRRRVLKAREQELSELSPAAKRMLRRLSNSHDTRNISIHPKIKQELRTFIERHRRRVAAKVIRAVA